MVHVYLFDHETGSIVEDPAADLTGMKNVPYGYPDGVWVKDFHFDFRQGEEAVAAQLKEELHFWTFYQSADLRKMAGSLVRKAIDRERERCARLADAGE